MVCEYDKPIEDLKIIIENDSFTGQKELIEVLLYEIELNAERIMSENNKIAAEDLDSKIDTVLEKIKFYNKLHNLREMANRFKHKFK